MDKLELAFNYVEYSKVSLFLSGKAGTGKTTFLKNLKEKTTKRMIVCAPTGVAAINAGGVTLHSMFQLSLAPYLPDLLSKELSFENRTANFRYRAERLKLLRSINLLVIDEISMVRADVLDAVSDALCRARRNREPFGGVQVLFIGDMRQLQPVAKEDERALLEQVYSTPYFFSSKVFSRMHFVCVELDHIFRQSDATFIDILNKIRDCTIDDNSIELLNSRYVKGIEKQNIADTIILTTHRRIADEINSSRMAELPSKEYLYDAEIDGKFPEYSYPTDSCLALKPGAQVMFVKNDSSGQHAWYNGKMAVVEECGDDSVTVSMTDEGGEKVKVVVQQEEWLNVRYAINSETQNVEEVVEGSFHQIPLRQAWAITIHKSQGLTFDKLIVDASHSFAHGQVYVALSRARSLEGLYLSAKIDRNVLIGNYSVDKFLKGTEALQAKENELEDYKNQYFLSLLVELFDYEAVYSALCGYVKAFVEKVDKEGKVFGDTLFPIVQNVHSNFVDVGERFARQLTHIVAESANPQEDSLLWERVEKGIGYFEDCREKYLSDTFFQNCVAAVQGSPTLLEHCKEKLLLLYEVVLEKKVLMGKVLASGKFDIDDYLKCKNDYLLNPMWSELRHRKLAFKTIDGSVKGDPLFKALNNWRKSTAEERGVEVTNVLKLKSLVECVEQRPQTLKELSAVKGIGKVTIKKYGEEILEIIKNY